MQFTDRKVEFPNRVELIKVESQDNIFDIKRAEGNIIKSGTPLNADNLNLIIKDLAKVNLSNVSNSDFAAKLPPIYEHNVFMSGSNFQLCFKFVSSDAGYGNQADLGNFLGSKNYQTDGSTNWGWQALSCSGYYASTNYKPLGVYVSNSNFSSFHLLYSNAGSLVDVIITITGLGIKSRKIF